MSQALWRILLGLLCWAAYSVPGWAQIALRGTASATVLTHVGSVAAFRGSSNRQTGADGDTSLTLDRPSNNPGDVLIAQVAVRGITPITAPAGWTLLNATSSSTPGSEVTQAIYSRVLQTGDPSSWTWSWAAKQRAGGGILQFQNIDTVGPVVAVGGQATNASTTITAPSQNQTVDGAMLAAFYASGRATSHSTPAGMTERYDQSTGAGPNGVTTSANTVFDGSAGPTDNKISTAGSSADNVGHLVVVSPPRSLTVAVPAGTLDGDVMIAAITYRPCSNTNNANCTTNVSTPSGWTVVRQLDTKNGAGVDGYGSVMVIYRRVAASEPASYTWFFGGTPRVAGAAGAILSFSGVDTASPIVAENGQVTPSGTSHTAPSIDTGAVSNTWLVSAHAANSSGRWNPPTGMTERIDIASRTPNDDLGIMLSVNTELFAASGTTGTRTASYTTPPNADTGSAHLLALRPAGLHHIRIEHTGSGVTCAPTTLTIKACADATCSSLYAGGVTGTLTATGTPTVNWVGGAGFTIDSTGSTTKQAQVITAGSVTWSTTGVSPAPTSTTDCYVGAAASCAFTSAQAGFLFDVPNHVSDTVQTLTVSAVKQADNSLACTPAFTNVSKTINFNCSYGDPASGTLPVVVGGSGIACGSASGVSLNFNASGVATTTVRYADVGQMNLTASYTGTSGSETGLIMNGSDSFIAAPASFSVAPTGPYVAGNPFSVKVTARNASGGKTPNFGKESTTENVTLGHALIGPADGNNPALGGTTTLADATFAAGNGEASANDLTWAEVGDISLTATLASGSYLGSGITATGSGAAGPFRPAYFDTEVTPACGGFTYSGQPFGLKVIAKNAVVDPDPEKTKTKNYAGSFAKNITLSDANGSAGAFSPAVIEASKFTAGIADLTTPASVAFTFANKLTAPATIKVRATDNEASSADGGAEGTTLIRSGRLRLANAHGSELRQLRVPVSAEYWNGTGFVTNPADSCTTVGAVTLNAPPSTCTLTPSVAGVGGALLNGTAALTLGAPNVRGCADMTMTTPSWLKGNWDGVDQPLPSGDGNIYDDNAAARATFGIFRDRLIFRREVTH